MIKIFTDCQRDYDLIKKIVEEHKELKYAVDIRKPKDSIAVVAWSIEDVRNLFPENTSDEIILDGFLEIEKTLKEDMIARGWDTIDTLDYIITENVDDEDDDFYDENCND